jgi:hypothetical protein
VLQKRYAVNQRASNVPREPDGESSEDAIGSEAEQQELDLALE